MSLRTIPVALLAAAALLAGASEASAASTYCSPSGDVCYGVVKRSPVRLRITTAAAYFARYRLCITGPDGGRDCRRFRMLAAPHGLRRSTVRWSRHFPNRGHGTYRVRYRSGGSALGPAITFRRTGPPSIRVRPSTVAAGNRVLVFGSAGGCPRGDEVTLLSRAFPATHEFAGVPAVTAHVRAGDRYRVTVRIPAGRAPGRYAITARCGGGNFGVRRTLTVT